MPLPVISVAQMREWEQLTWRSGQSQAAVIQRAGQEFARHLLNVTRTGDAILILAGKGHNGDDARAAGKKLPLRRTHLLDVTDPAKAILPVKRWISSQHPEHSWIVDGLFGIGLNRPLEGGWLELVHCINAAGRPVAAVDVPSGLDADTGKPLGEAIRAAMTVTFGAPKQGLLEAAAAEYVGRLEVAPEIGLIPCPVGSPIQWTVADDFTGFPPHRPIAGHKGSFGHLCIIAGSLGYHGAAVLAAHGAQRAQPGLITVVTPPEVYTPIASQLCAPMVKLWDARMDFTGFTSILFGPGLANPQLPPSLKRAALALWKSHPGTVVVDASGLDWLKTSNAKPKGCRVITPHPGEAARMLDKTTAAIQSDRVRALRELSEKYGGCAVVLKGHQTLVGQANTPIFVNPTGNPHLAQGGAGDVLAGLLAGLLAQPALAKNPVQTARHAVWCHGLAADELTRRLPNWTIADLIQQLGNS